MVRLKFDDVEKPKRLPKKKKTLKRKKPTDKDFDSEEEYGKENAESSSDYEMDDGHISEGDEDAYEFVKPEEEEEVVEKEVVVMVVEALEAADSLEAEAVDRMLEKEQVKDFQVQS